MLISARRSRPIRRPPPRVAPAQPLRIPLPIASPPQTPTRKPLAADPFTPHKILNHIDRLRQFAAGQLIFPITVEIDPTDRCNHRCEWCVSERSHSGKSLDLSRFQSLMKELRQADVRSIVLKGGGEPTLHPQFNEMLDAAHGNRLGIGLITNGSMPRPGSREKILQTCQWVRISLDAATAQMHRQIHGSADFSRILQNIAYLTANTRGTTIGLNFVAEHRNFHQMSRFAELGRSLGVAYVTIRCVFDPGHSLSPEIRDAMRDQAIIAKQSETDRFRVFLGNFTDRYLTASNTDPLPYPRCLGPNLIGIIGGDGNVYACCFLRGHAEFAFGNVNEHSFREIWTSPRRQQVMNTVHSGRCDRICAGGLTAHRYNLYNEILNYLCANEKPHSAFA